MPAGASGSSRSPRQLRVDLLHAALDLAHVVAGSRRSAAPVARPAGAFSQRRHLRADRIQQALRLAAPLAALRRRCCRRRTAARTPPAGCSPSAAAAWPIFHDSVLRYAQVKPASPPSGSPARSTARSTAAACPGRSCAAATWSTVVPTYASFALDRMRAAQEHGRRARVVLGAARVLARPRRHGPVRQVADDGDADRGTARAACRISENSKSVPVGGRRPLVHRGAVRDVDARRAGSSAWPPSAPARCRPESSSRAAAAPRVTPAPRRNVRRDRCFLVMKVTAAGLRGIRDALRLHLERGAAHDAADERREPVVVGARRRRTMRAHGRHVVVLDACGRARRSAASPRPSSTNALASVQQRLRAGRRGPSAACRRPACRTRPRATPPSASRHLPIRSKFSSAKPIGSITRVARRAGRVGAVLLQALPQRWWARRRPPVGSSRFVSTPGGGGGGGVPSRFSSTHWPRFTGEVRLGAEVTVSTLPCPSRPRRAASVSVDAAEAAAADVAACRSAGRAARRRTCSRRRAGRATLRSSRRIVANNSSVSRWNGVAQVAVEVAACRVDAVSSWRSRSHWPREVRRTSASARRIGQHAPHLLLEHRAAASARRRRRQRSSSSSGMLLHRKNDSRDASSMSLMPVDGARPACPRARARSGR